jgi:RNA recognition motif-containing protein
LAFFDSVFSNQRTQLRDSEPMNIYVGNLPFSITDADLRETFAKFGEVAQVNLITDKFTGESKGFGFVEMANNSQADAAIKGLNGKDLKGRNITVNQAKPKTDRPTRDRRY